MRIECSSMFFTPDNCSSKIRDISGFLKSHGFGFGIQLHNSISRDLYNVLLPYRGEFQFTIHSPAFSKYFVNLASGNVELALSILKECDTLTAQWNSNLMFFHGFFLAHSPIVHDMKNYRKVMRQSIGPQYALNNSFIMDPAIFATDQFAEFKQYFVTNIERVKECFPHKVISLENDFPGMGSGLQRPEEIHELIENVWFDLGHFWCSSLLHGFDFHQESLRLIDEKKIVGVHLNHNLCTTDTPREQLNDSHTHFYNESAMNLPPIIRKIVDSGIDSLTLEIVDGDIDDVRILVDWIL
ncbi:MAG TPA: hypothetical protein VHO70_21710 [Chitinispirillaceae bacterium]|nr:hypothetical protein [Chitinispirillaceae bacterium]